MAHPTNSLPRESINPAVVVAVQDASGKSVAGAALDVTVALGENPTGATLSGILTVTATNGIATFSDLRVDRPGNGYTLAATARELDGATSNAFSVTIMFASVSAGNEHTCGVTPEGAAYCWGNNFWGALGTSANSFGSTSPLLVEGGLSFAAVSAGGYEFTCGLTTEGRAYCWGVDWMGQLGDGPSGGNNCSGGIKPCSDVPVPVAGGLTFAVVSAGDFHACGITSEGIAYCWGNNDLGELGIGTATGPEQCSPVGEPIPCATEPVAVSGGLRFTSLSTDGAHTCGVTTGGATYCWGSNGQGELGIGSFPGPEDCAPRLAGPCSTVPVAVVGDLTLASVAPGTGHTCGVTTSRDAYCWGSNYRGQLGIGIATGPEQCSPPAPEEPPLPCSTEPVAVSGGLQFSSLSAASDHTCGVTTGGATYCWGSNVQGELGIGTATGPEECYASSPCSTAPVRVLAPDAFGSLSAGSYHTCGVTTGRKAYCWGSNNSGQIGDGTSIDRHLPTKVAGQP